MASLYDLYRSRGAAGLVDSLARGADPNERDVLGVPLICDVAAAGDVESLRVLLDKGADIEGAASNGWTPLIHAANGGHEDAVRLLIARGARRDATTEEGYTAADRAPRNKPTLLALLAEP